MSATESDRSVWTPMKDEEAPTGMANQSSSPDEMHHIGLPPSESGIPAGETAPPVTKTDAPGPPAPPPGSTVDSTEPPPSYRTIGTILVLICFAVSVGSGIGFLVAYWTNHNNMLLGGTLALCLLGFGCALVFWSHWLMRQSEVSAPREPLSSSPDEYEALFEEFYPREPNIHRRKLLVAMSTAVVATLAAAWLSVFRSFFGASPYGAPLSSTIWKRGQRLVMETGDMASIHSLDPGGAVIVFPENMQGYVSAQTVLVRVKQEYLQLPKNRTGWAPMGYLAYSRVCTHAGCPVGLFEAENDLLLCPCHQSTFDILNGAEPTGGPAARPLPQLPLYVDDEGYLRAGGGFTAPPGPGYWSMRS